LNDCSKYEAIASAGVEHPHPSRRYGHYSVAGPNVTPAGEASVVAVPLMNAVGAVAALFPSSDLL